MNKSTFAPDEEEYIKNNYGIVSYRDMAKHLGRNWTSIRTVARRVTKILSKKEMGKSKFGGKKQAAVSSDFFSKHTLLSCYYAGFIAADGNVFSVSENNKRLSIKLAIKDLRHLELFKDAISYAGRIEIKNTKYKYKGVVKTKPSCLLRINNVQIVNDLLLNFGIHANKTFTLQFPNSLSELNHIDAFILGYMDGDGCIQHTSSRMRITILGSMGVLVGIARRFSALLKKNIPVTLKQKKSRIHKVDICGDDARAIFEHYYALSQYLPCLKRKWNSEFLTN